MIRRSLTAGILLSACALHPVFAAVPSANFDSLVRNSPFNGPVTANPGKSSDTPLEFRGMIMDGGEPFFSIFEAASKSSLWVGLNEPGHPYKVQSFDGEKGVAVIEYQGRTLSLPLKQAKVVSLVPNAPNPGGTSGQPGGGPQTLGPAANPADEAARLAAVGEEIRRRRSMRQQQTGQQPAQNTPGGQDAQGPRFIPPQPNQQGPLPMQPIPPKPVRN